MKSSKGFTLIELLVVVAIIGVLSAVVIASTNSARVKAWNTKVIAEMMRIRTDLEIISGDQGGAYYVYVEDPYYLWRACSSNRVGETQGVGSGGGSVGMLFAEIVDLIRNEHGSGVMLSEISTGVYNMISCHDKVDAYVLQVPLKNSTATSPRLWCMDSRGASRLTTTPLATYQFECPAS
jgi:type IV pilus assembly protein PilA